MNDGSTKEMPVVSVGVPVYNGASTISCVLDGLIHDDYRNLEIIISDNASTDDTETICRDYAARDSRIKYHRNVQNIGGVGNFLSVFRMSSGKYFLWASHHDMRERNFISRCVDTLEADPGVSLCYSNAAWLEAGNRIGDTVPRPFETTGLDPWARFFKTLRNVGYCYQIYGVIRRDMLGRCLLPSPGLGADHVWLQELSIMGTFVCLPERLFLVWRDEDAKSIHASFKRGNRTLTPGSAVTAAREMISCHIQIVRTHLLDRSSRIRMTAKVLCSVLIRYRRLFIGVFLSSFVRPAQRSEAQQHDKQL
jgi:glycosyltransferase involved in cell wall biosynthesis